MATLDDSPSVYSGQSWSTWAEKVPLGEEDDPDEDDPSKRKNEETNSMKLRKEDLPLFGYCPAQDELYLVVCEKCGQVVKPQALKAHIEKRHGSKDYSQQSSRLQSSATRGSHCPGLSSHRSSPQLHSSKSGGKSSLSVKVDRSISDSVKMTSVEVSLERLSGNVKTVSLNSDSNKSQHSPKTSCNLTNSVSNGTMKSSSNGAMATSIDSSPSIAPSIGSIYCASSYANNVSPMHNSNTQRSSTSSSYSTCSPSKNVLTSGHISNSPIAKCDSPIERTSEKGQSSESSSSTKNHSSGYCKSPAAVIGRSVSKTPSSSSKTKSASSHLVKTVSNSAHKPSSSTKPLSSSPSKNSAHVKTSPLRPAPSPVKHSPSPAKNVSSPGKSAPSPGKSALINSPVKSAPSPTRSPSKTVSLSPSHCSGSSSTPRKSSKSKGCKPLCKDRKFDPNVHCGVVRTDDGRHCTRSLTCKTHALSLRRAVSGRRMDFDDLLKEHRARNDKKSAGGPPTSSPKPPTPDGSVKLSGSIPDLSVTMKECKSPPPLLSPKHSHPLTSATTKLGKPSNPVNSLHHSRLSHFPWSLKEEMSPPSEGLSRLSSDDLDTEDGQDKADNPYMSHHPRPISMCTFGGRYASSGLYLFNRKTDYLRSAFLSALEKHLHPPPHKKLCVESKLPRDPQLLSNSMDPYEFNIGDMGGGAGTNNPVNSINKSPSIKQKSKPASNKPSKSKGDMSPRVCQPSVPNSPSSTGPQSGQLFKRKRNSSGASNSSSSNVSMPNTTSVSLQNATVLGNVSLKNSTPFIATCIPNVNLSSNTLSRFNTSLSTNTGHQNNVIKDGSTGMNLVVATNMDQCLSNGQYLNLTGNMLDMAAGQTAGHVEEKQSSNSKRSRSGGGNTATKSNRLNVTKLEKHPLIPTSNNIMTAVQGQKAILLDKPLLTPETLSAFPANAVSWSKAFSSISPAHTSATPTQFFRSGSLSPHVSSSSPSPNGTISPSPLSVKTAIGQFTSHKTGGSPTTSRNSTPSPNIHDSPNQTTHLTFIGPSSGSQKTHSSKSSSSNRINHLFTTGPASSANHTNIRVTNASLGSLPLKGQSVIATNIPLHMPFGIPLTMASSAGSLTNHQQPTTTLFVTSDNVSKGEITLQQTAPTTSNVIS